MTERRKERTVFRDAERKEVKRSKVCVCVGGGGGVVGVGLGLSGRPVT